MNVWSVYDRIQCANTHPLKFVRSSKGRAFSPHTSEETECDYSFCHCNNGVLNWPEIKTTEEAKDNKYGVLFIENLKELLSDEE